MAIKIMLIKIMSCSQRPFSISCSDLLLTFAQSPRPRITICTPRKRGSCNYLVPNQIWRAAVLCQGGQLPSLMHGQMFVLASHQQGVDPSTNQSRLGVKWRPRDSERFMAYLKFITCSAEESASEKGGGSRLELQDNILQSAAVVCHVQTAHLQLNLCKVRSSSHRKCQEPLLLLSSLTWPVE